MARREQRRAGGRVAGALRHTGRLDDETLRVGGDDRLRVVEARRETAR